MNNIQKLTINSGRLFIVGDIHGMFSLLYEKLAALGFDEQTDTLVSVGDIVDRGLESERFAEFLDKPYVFCVKGNHEDMMFKALARPSISTVSLWYNNGGGWSHEIMRDLQKQVSMYDLPIAIEIDFSGKKIGVVHAGVPFGINDWNEYKEDLLKNDTDIKNESMWNRNRSSRIIMDKSKRIENIDLVVSGHTIVDEIKISTNSVLIDTGAFKLSPSFKSVRNKSNDLTVIEIIPKNKSIVIINNKKKYKVA
jgi:serine/threonine protein phosphatase 1